MMIVFPVLIPVQNFLFPGTGREKLKCHGKGRDGKFEACIPGNHGKREFPLTPDLSNAAMLVYRIKIACVIFCIFHQIDCKILFSACMMLPQSWPQPTMNEGFKLNFKICLTLQWTLKLTITTSVFIEERWRPIEHNLQCLLEEDATVRHHTRPWWTYHDIMKRRNRSEIYTAAKSS